MENIRRCVTPNECLFERASQISLTPTVGSTSSICRINSPITRLLLTNWYFNNPTYYSSVTCLLLTNWYIQGSYYNSTISCLLLTNRYIQGPYYNGAISCLLLTNRNLINNPLSRNWISCINSRITSLFISNCDLFFYWCIYCVSGIKGCVCYAYPIRISRISPISNMNVI